MRMGESTTQMTVDGGRRDCELAWSARRKKMGAKATPTRWKRVRGVENVMKFGVRRSWRVYYGRACAALTGG